MLRYIFRILFSSLCCAVIDFVAGIVHGVLLIYSDFGLVIYHTLIQFPCYHRYRLYSTLVLSNLILYFTDAVVE